MELMVLSGMSIMFFEQMYKRPSRNKRLAAATACVGVSVFAYRWTNRYKFVETRYGELPSPCQLGVPPKGYRLANPAIDGPLDPNRKLNIDMVNKETGRRDIYTDCYDSRVSQRNLLHQEFDNNEELVIRLAQALMRTPVFRFELWLTSWLRWLPVPTWQFQSFNEADPPMGIYHVEHRSDKEICWKWKFLGMHGRTWVGVNIDEQQDIGYDNPMFLQYGTSMWPYRPESWLHRNVTTPIHAFHAKVLLAQATDTFITAEPPAIAKRRFKEGKLW